MKRASFHIDDVHLDRTNDSNKSYYDWSRQYAPHYTPKVTPERREFCQETLSSLEKSNVGRDSPDWSGDRSSPENDSRCSNDDEKKYPDYCQTLQIKGSHN